jgi:hypothetical protein
MGLTPKQLDGLTLREFFYKLSGYYEARHAETRVAFESARLTATIILNALSEKPVQPRDVVRFAWEEQKTFPRMDPELFNKRIKKLK